ncbi:MAG: hypothetical protein ACERKD_07975 [Prolixibacteraceae bacterium]
MALLRSIKNEYEFYHHQSLNILVALDAENQQILSAFWKTNKGKKKESLPKLKVNGFQFIKDEELDSLKIDFSKICSFDAVELISAK